MGCVKQNVCAWFWVYRATGFNHTEMKLTVLCAFTTMVRSGNFIILIFVQDST
jgi:hypothetical protein